MGVYRGIEKRLARTRGVRAAVKVTAEAIGDKARANLAGHRETGESRIVVQHDAVDSLVILDDPASLSIEFGHAAYVRKDGRHVGASEGIHVLRGAL